MGLVLVESKRLDVLNSVWSQGFSDAYRSQRDQPKGPALKNEERGAGGWGLVSRREGARGWEADGDQSRFGEQGRDGASWGSLVWQQPRDRGEGWTTAERRRPKYGLGWLSPPLSKSTSQGMKRDLGGSQSLCEPGLQCLSGLPMDEGG
jgi:hypothetical protein